LILVDGAYLAKLFLNKCMKKDLTKAVKVSDHLMKAHIRNADNIEKLVKEWDESSLKEIGKIISDTHRDVAKCIYFVKMCIVGDCKHPKKMHDTTKDGQKYCMQCNNDLE